MLRTKRVPASFAATSTLAALLTWAVAAEAAVQVAHLRKDCSGIPDCFTTTTDLTNWIANVRQPTQVAPLTVAVGPGEFEQIGCGPGLDPPAPSRPSFAYVTFRGAGREQTVFTGPSCVVACAAIEAAAACKHLEFKDLTARGDRFGVLWRSDAGDSVWTDTDIFGAASAWYELTALPCNPATNFARHLWFNSRLIATAPDGQTGLAYQANCGESHFFNSEIIVRAGASTPANTSEGIAAFSIGANPDINSGVRKGVVRLFSSRVRLSAANWLPAEPPPGHVLAAVRVFDDGDFKMEGGVVEVIANEGLDATVLGVKVGNGGAAHTAETGFDVRRVRTLPTPTPGGPPTPTSRSTDRVGRDEPPAAAILEAPYLHAPGTALPRADPDVATSPLLGSVLGADLFVETDCNGSGICSGSGSHTHLMIYNPACCPSAKWFNSSTGKCRNATASGCE